jgi:tRNA threonylcarbamoyladenosine biosynthesis protein TsaE
LAGSLAARLSGGEVLLLQGELGAGKTAFVRGLAAGLGISPDEVTSPSFVLLTSHRGRIDLHHADLFRVEVSPEELGLDELPGPTAVLAVEWPERLSWIPWARVVRVRLEHLGADTRRVVIEEDAA